MSVSVKTVFVRATGVAANPTAEDIRRVTIPAAVLPAGAFEFVCAHVRKTYALSAAAPLQFRYRDDEDEWITISSADELHDAIAAATAARPLRLYISASADVNFAALQPVPATPTPTAAVPAAAAAAAAAPPALNLPASTPNSKADIKAEPVAALAVAAPAPVAAAAVAVDVKADVKADAKTDVKSPAASVASVGSAKDGGADDDGFLHVSASDLQQSVAAVAKPASPAAAAPAPAPAPVVEPVATPKPEEAKATPAPAPVPVPNAPAPVTVTPIVALAPVAAADVKADVKPVAADEKQPVAAAAVAAAKPAAAEEAIHEGVSCDGCGAKPIRGVRYNCVTCPNYDLCAACERDPKKHPVTHAMLKIRKPIDYAAIAKQQQAQSQAADAKKPEAKKAAEFKAEYEKDVTIEDCSKVVPGAAMHKVWRVRNAGATQWPAGTALSFVGGEVTPAAVQPADLVPVPAAKPGESVDVGAYLVMPQKAGRARGYYRLQLPAAHGGAHFGSRMWIDVLVVPHSEMPNAPAPDAAAKPTPSTVAPAVAAVAADVKVEAVAPKPAEPKAAPAPVAVTAAPKPDVKAAEPAAKAAPAPAAAKPKASAGPAYKYQKELDALVGMGFKDQELVMYLLSNNSGDINRVVNWMLQNNAH